MSEEKKNKTETVDPNVIPLNSPLKVGDNEITSITLRQPLVEDLLDAAAQAGPGSGNFAIEAYTVAIVSGVPIEDLRKMKSYDYYAVTRRFRVLDDGLEAGEFASSS
ncbi:MULTISPECIES: phage tail assembly protein [unclassified Maridesulfovibrio]|uniref:phage tail assembly protein n=1 Tax=unclassified Maridesulfovibrio TaxID=2794999 RepID=UPI003B4226F7